jgi:hypothetical protein
MPFKAPNTRNSGAKESDSAEKYDWELPTALSCALCKLPILTDKEASQFISVSYVPVRLLPCECGLFHHGCIFTRIQSPGGLSVWEKAKYIRCPICMVLLDKIQCIRLDSENDVVWEAPKDIRYAQHDEPENSMLVVINYELLEMQMR